MASTLNGTSLNVGGPVTCTTVDTGQGATEVHLMNQNLRTTDSPTFAAITAGTINTGPGATEVHLMNQNLRTTDSVTFKNITATESEGTRSAGSYVCFSRTSASTVSSTSYTRVPGYVFKFKKAGVYTVIFRMKCNSQHVYEASYGRIYVNGSAVGTERSLNGGESSTSNFSQNITLQAGAVLEIRAHEDRADKSTTIEWCYINQNEEGPIYDE
jgi:hypothetical protein